MKMSREKVNICVGEGPQGGERCCCVGPPVPQFPCAGKNSFFSVIIGRWGREEVNVKKVLMPRGKKKELVWLDGSRGCM